MEGAEVVVREEALTKFHKHLTQKAKVSKSVSSRNLNYKCSRVNQSFSLIFSRIQRRRSKTGW